MSDLIQYAFNIFFVMFIVYQTTINKKQVVRNESIATGFEYTWALMEKDKDGEIE